MRRRLFNLLSAVSLVMLLGIGVLSWPHGGPAGRLIIVTRHDIFHTSFLSYATYTISGKEPSDGSRLATGGYRIDRSDQWKGLGFEVWKATNGSLTGWYIWIPCYILLGLTGALPAWWLVNNVRFRRPCPP